MSEILPRVLVNAEQVDVHVVVGLDHKLCLLTKLGHPGLPHDALVGEVVVRVVETSLDNVTEPVALPDNLPVQVTGAGTTWYSSSPVSSPAGRGSGTGEETGQMRRQDS